MKRDLKKDTNEVLKLMSRAYKLGLFESSGAQRVFEPLSKVLEKARLRPNNIIDTSAHSMTNIIDGLNNIGYEFKKETDDGKLHYFSDDTKISLYLNPVNRKISLIP